MKEITRNCKFCKLFDGTKCLKYGKIKNTTKTCLHCVDKYSDEDISEYENIIDMAELFDD